MLSVDTVLAISTFILVVFEHNDYDNNNNKNYTAVRKLTYIQWELKPAANSNSYVWHHDWYFNDF